MNIKDRAMEFAIMAFDGKVRKAEPEKDSVLHSIDVANKLSFYGFDDNVVAAGYLHDIVEDTKYTLEDIRDEFGDDIASLVEGATEEDRSLSWEDRKQATINRIRDLDLRHKAVIACDKLSNTEDLLYLFGRIGKEDYSAFTRGKDKKRWYWEGVYKSLIYKQNEDMSMFRDLKNNIDSIFYNRKVDNDIIYYKKLELCKLQAFINNKGDYNVEISGNYIEKTNDIIDSLGKIVNLDDFSIVIDENNVVDKLVEVDIDYLNGKLPSDVYIELLDRYVTYIWDNIDNIIYIRSMINSNEKYIKSVNRVFNIFKNNNIKYEIVDDIDMKITVNEVSNRILDSIRAKRLRDVKKLTKGMICNEST